MIIACINCHRKFDIESNLIPDKGRLLQCSVCNHEWFFKKKFIDELITPIKIKNEETIELLDNTPKFKIDTEDKSHENEIIFAEGNKSINEPLSKIRKQNSYKILNLLVVSLISFVSFIIIIDTFKFPISKIVPNIEFLLNNLYEILKDVTLFFKDLF